MVDDAKMQRRWVDATTQAKLWITFGMFCFMYSGLGAVGVLWMYWVRWVGAVVKPSPGVWVLGEAIRLSRGWPGSGWLRWVGQDGPGPSTRSWMVPVWV